MQEEFIVNWNPKYVDQLNEELPAILRGVRFELEPVKLTVSTPTSCYEIDGQPQVKIIVSTDSKEDFKSKLRYGHTINDQFPRFLSQFIQDNLKIPVY